MGPACNRFFCLVLANLLDLLLTYDDKERLTIEEVLRHPFIGETVALLRGESFLSEEKDQIRMSPPLKSFSPSPVSSLAEKSQNLMALGADLVEDEEEEGQVPEDLSMEPGQLSLSKIELARSILVEGRILKELRLDKQEELDRKEELRFFGSIRELYLSKK